MLARWKRHGLLDPPTRIGKGWAQGVKRFMDADTPARAILIARTLEDSKSRGKKPSLDRGARTLVGTGRLVEGDLLRRLLHNELTEHDKALRKRRQHFFRLSESEARARLDESTERRHAGTAPEGLWLLKQVVAGLAGVGSRLSLAGKLLQLLSFSNMQEAVGEAPQAVLRDAVQEVMIAIREPEIRESVATVMAQFGLLAGDGGKAVLTAFDSAARGVEGDPEKVSISDCQDSASLLLILSAEWLTGRRVPHEPLGSEIVEAAANSGPDNDPFVTMLRILRGTGEREYANDQDAER